MFVWLIETETDWSIVAANTVAEAVKKSPYSADEVTEASKFKLVE